MESTTNLKAPVGDEIFRDLILSLRTFLGSLAFGFCIERRKVAQEPESFEEDGTLTSVADSKRREAAAQSIEPH